MALERSPDDAEGGAILLLQGASATPAATDVPAAPPVPNGGAVATKLLDGDPPCTIGCKSFGETSRWKRMPMITATAKRRPAFFVLHHDGEVV